MIEKNPQHDLSPQTNVRRDLERAKRIGVMPSNQLRRHFFSLARQVIRWSESRDAPFSIGITSVARRVGRSTVAFNLASALSKLMQQNVLLVESDFGKHFVSRRMGKAGIAGLSDIMQQQSNSEECILPTPLGGLWVLGSGSVSERDSIELPFEELRGIIQRLEGYGGYVFDLPVANELTACFSVAPILDGLVMVVDAAELDHRQIIKVRKQLETFGVDIVGMVINKS